MPKELPNPIQREIDRWLVSQGASPRHWIAKPVIGSGLSKARIWRLEFCDQAAGVETHSFENQTRNQGFAIRCWGRSGQHRASIERILYFQKAASLGFIEMGNNSFSPLDKIDFPTIVPGLFQWPDREWCAEYADSVWTIETWLPGVPLAANAFVSDSLLDQAFDCLERLHGTGRRLGIERRVPPGVVERSERLREWSSTAWKTKWRSSIETLDMSSQFFAFRNLSQTLKRTVEQLHSNGASLQQQLQRWLVPQDCHWVVRDLWRENILVDQDRITGVIDFGAARIDWPSLEMVRWLSSWLAPDDLRLKLVCDSHSPMTADGFRFFDHLSTLLSLLQWFDWILNSNISFDGKEQQVQNRIDELAQRLLITSK